MSVYDFGKLDVIVNKYNNTYHSATKIKPVVVTSNTYINSSQEINDKNPKFRIGDIVKISKYENLFGKCYVPNLSEEVFVIRKIKNTVSWVYVITDLRGKVIVGNFYEKEFQKTN